MKQFEVLAAARPVIEALGRLGVPYEIGGSVASSTYGFARATMDVDLVAPVRSEDARPIVEALESSYYVDETAILRAIRDESSFNLVHLETGVKIDVFVLKRGAYPAQALARRRLETVTAEEGSEPLYLAAPEDLILAKLDWYRMSDETSERQWTDVLGVLKVQQGRLDLEYLRRWAQELGSSPLLERALREASR